MTDTSRFRRTAAHIRYLAGAPTAWDADSDDWDIWEVRERDRRGWWSRLIGRTRRPTRALHIAAWNPATAHLVADLLDCAATLGATERHTAARDHCGWCGADHLTQISNALTQQENP